MYLLDTNVLSEIMKSDPHANVARWIELRIDEPLFTTSISKAEILAGVTALPAGRRRRALDAAATRILENFQGLVLPFDDVATAAYAQILEARLLTGRPIQTADLLIASIARVHNATVVTRDVGGFELTGVPIINPWDPQPT